MAGTTGVRSPPLSVLRLTPTGSSATKPPFVPRKSKVQWGFTPVCLGLDSHCRVQAALGLGPTPRRPPSRDVTSKGGTPVCANPKSTFSYEFSKINGRLALVTNFFCSTCLSIRRARPGRWVDGRGARPIILGCLQPAWAGCEQVSKLSSGRA